MCYEVDIPNIWGFLGADLENNTNANLPLKYKSSINILSQKVIQYLSKPGILSSREELILKSSINNGYACLWAIYLQIHPKTYICPITVCSRILI